MENNIEQKRPVVSGNNIMLHSEEALQEKRLTISSLIDKLNADVVVGDIVDDYEEDRKKTVEEQKELLQKEQDEQEALRRQELEEQRLAEEAAAQEAKNTKKQTSDNDTKKSLAFVVSDLSRKAKTEFFKNNALKKIFKADDIPEVDDDEEEPSVEIPEIDDKLEKKSKKEKKRQQQAEAPEDDDLEIEIPEESKKKMPRKEAKVKQKKEKPPKKSSKHENKPSSRKVTVSYGEEYFDETIEEPKTSMEEFDQSADTEPEQTQEVRENIPQRHNGIQEEVRRSHEPTNEDEVYRFCNALERLSDDSYCSVSVYAACIIDKDFKSLSIIKDVSYLAELIADSGYSLDFYFAYIITNRGVQHYGNDEAISEVSIAMESLRTLFIQKKGRVHVEQVQKLPALRIFETIYLEDNNRAMRQ